jgi:phosphopantetheinyl transferase
MPLYKTIKPNKKTIVLIWKIEEDLSFLSTIYINANSVLRLQNMKSVIHKKGFLSVRHLLKTLDYTDDDLFYTNDGKPHLRDGKRISITHSFEYSAIIISDYVVGIDIEKNREKIIKIASKFIGKEKDYVETDCNIYKANKDKKDFLFDIEVIKNDLIKKLTQIWGAKESLFKIHPDGGLLFKHHLHIKKFSSNGIKTKGWIKKDNFHEVYTVHFVQIDGFTLVYALN